MTSKRTVSGSITVEAAITLPVFLCVIFSIVFFMKIVRTQELVQHAIYESAVELSSVSYVFHVSGLEEVHDSAQKGIESNSGIFKDHAGIIFDSLKDLKLFTSSSPLMPEKESPAENYSDIEEITKNFKEIFKMTGDITSDPQKELKSIACYIAGGYFEDLKTEVCVPLVRLYMGKYLLAGSKTNLDDRLRRLGIKNGLSGLDFSSSRFLEDESENIEVVVSYRMSLPIPFKFFNDPIIVQKATVKAWLGGDDPGEATDGKQDEIWSLTNFQRGLKIREIYGANLPESFPVISRFSKGTATLIKSMDITASSYKDTEYTREKICGYIDKLAGYKGQEGPWGSKDIVIRESQINSRELLLVIPGNTLEPAAENAIEESRRYAESKGVAFRLEKYGRVEEEGK